MLGRAILTKAAQAAQPGSQTRTAQAQRVLALHDRLEKAVTGHVNSDVAHAALHGENAEYVLTELFKSNPNFLRTDAWSTSPSGVAELAKTAVDQGCAGALATRVVKELAAKPKAKKKSKAAVAKKKAPPVSLVQSALDEMRADRRAAKNTAVRIDGTPQPGTRIREYQDGRLVRVREVMPTR